MALEIERKFLVQGNFKPSATNEIKIMQGYLSSVPERTVRVRIIGDKGYLTIKGAANTTGVSRFEWEIEIPVEEAYDLIELSDSEVIDKTRFIVPEGSGLYFEVDVFSGNNLGLIIAEIELPSEDHPFEKPHWLGEEVTGDVKYYNSMLVKNPYSKWD